MDVVPFRVLRSVTVFGASLAGRAVRRTADVAESVVPLAEGAAQNAADAADAAAHAARERESAYRDADALVRQLPDPPR